MQQKISEVYTFDLIFHYLVVFLLSPITGSEASVVHNTLGFVTADDIKDYVII